PAVLARVDGRYSDLEVINSGSVFELDNKTLALIKSVCKEKDIRTLHFEAHYLYRDRIPALRQEFGESNVKMKLGLETFDREFRENVLKKGIRESDPKIISKGFDEANFLFGVKGQSVESMSRDIQLGLKYFERICVNVMCENTSTISPDKNAIKAFVENIYPEYKDNERVDILLNNTDFGVGD
ncbi:MAG: radical SAM protein, partial [Clostridia bacterium]|nr:radical SAM protein [Clostridia bacterium]